MNFSEYLDEILSAKRLVPNVKEYLLNGYSIILNTRQVYTILEPPYEIYVLEAKKYDKSIKVQSRKSLNNALFELERKLKEDKTSE